MGGKGGGDKSTGQQVTQVQLPEWVNQASQSNYKLAQQVAGRPYEAYGGQTVAGLDPAFRQAYGQLGEIGTMQPAYGQAADALGGMLGYNPRDIRASRVQAGQLANTDLQPYLNPYTNEVERRAIENAERSGQAAQNRLGVEAQQKGAFGGSRQAMQQAIQGAETTRGIGDLSAQLRQQGFESATERASKDIANRLTAETQTGNWAQEAQKASVANQIAALQAKTGAAGQLTQTADAYQKAKTDEINTKVAMGQISQEQAQRELDDLANKWQAERDAPLENLNILMSALGMSPYGRTEITNKTETSKAGRDAGGIFGSLLGGIGGIGKLFGLSDRTLKTDITRLGHDPALDLPIYAYRYKGDPKSYPKVAGPMAQDVEKKYPHLVSKVAGKRVIRLDRLTP